MGCDCGRASWLVVRGVLLVWPGAVVRVLAHERLEFIEFAAGLEGWVKRIATVCTAVAEAAMSHHDGEVVIEGFAKVREAEAEEEDERDADVDAQGDIVVGGQMNDSLAAGATKQVGQPEPVW